MPRNDDLKPAKQPMTVRFGEKPTTEFKNNLESIDIGLIDCPTMDQLRSYLPIFLEATWSDHSTQANDLSIREKDELIKQCLKGKALPTALETIGCTFRIDGISLQEVTHILRYRRASFSADCSADKWWTHKAALVPEAIENSPEYLRRYKKITKDAKKLYCDMIDSKEISIMDARNILTRNLETFYFMRMSVADALHFIRQRIDRQIQPETDNIMAYQMYIELVQKLPILSGIIDINATPKFWVANARSGKSTNLYVPDESADVYDWNIEDFMYQRTREEVRGQFPKAESIFIKYKKMTEEILGNIKTLNDLKLEEEYCEDENTTVALPTPESQDTLAQIGKDLKNDTI